MTMELPKHTCISCAYLCQKANEYYGISPRHLILEKKQQEWVVADYKYLVCYKGKLPNFYLSGKTGDEIRDIVIKPNTCKQWIQFINGISPIAIEQRQSTKWAKRAFWIAIASLAAILATWILSQFVLN
jgi:hypothetical protein